MIDVNITLEQCQLAYEGGMDGLALKLFTRAVSHLCANVGETEALNVVAEILTEDCIDTLREYQTLITSDPAEHAAYEDVISSIFLL